MKRWHLLLLLLLLIVLSLAIPAQIVFSGVVNSTTGQFNVTPSEVYLNYSNSYSSNVSILSYNASWEGIKVELINGTITPNYTQGFPTDPNCQQIPIFVKNNSQYGNIVGPLSSVDMLNATLTHIYMDCYPGRYRTDRFTIRNSTQANESANISVIIDIPVSITNTLSNATRIGTFIGRLPYNTSTYHSFYFNATNSPAGEIANATGVLINLNSTSHDIDMFLFDNLGNFLAKSINKTGNESLLYNYLPSTSQMWEIRIYGNHTSEIPYTGNIIFTTLNITNTTNQTITQIDLGTTNVNATDNKTTNIRLINQGNLSLSNVAESKELYYVKRFSGNIPSNFTFLVPDSSITTKVKVSLNWTGASNYSFSLYNQDNSIVASSAAKSTYANITGAVQEEYDETMSIGSSSKFWRVQVLNSTNTSEPYNLTVYLYVDTADWITTNYTTQTLNRTGGTGSENYTVDVKVNLTVPASEAMNGTYEGYIQYLDDKQVGIKLPIKFNVITPMLLVNDTMDSGTFRVDENYGFNLTRILYFNITNPGNYDLNLTLTDSGNLSYSSYNASFVYNSTSFLIPANRYSILNVNITFNSSLPKNTVYSGWIKVNSTNITSNFTAHPYALYTINLQLNLTDLLDVRTDFISADGTDKIIYNSSVAENITIKTDVYYLNGTGPITDLASLSNFSYVWLQERNVTGSDGRINLTFYNGTTYGNGVWCTGGSCPSPSLSTWGGNNHYYINATVPAKKPGGLYNVWVAVNYTLNYSQYVPLSTYSGQGVSNILIINNTGLHMSTNVTGCSFGSSCSSSASITNTSTYRLFVNVSNYGTLANSSAAITLSENCAGYSVSSPTYSPTCSNFNVPAQNTSCLVYWDISAGTSAADACTSNIIGNPPSQWFNPNGINVSITITAGGSSSSSTSPSSSSQSTTTTVPTYTANLAFTKADSLIAVQQNSSNSTEVGVSNTGTVNQNITFTIENINSSWYSLNATNAYLVVGKGAGFKVNFNVGNVEVKDYNGTFKAFSANKTITSNFALRVTPAPTTKIEINQTLASYKLNMTKLEQEISQKKKQGFNTTAVEKKFADLNSSIQKAEDYIKAGDYNNAYYLFDNIKSLLSEIKDDLSKVKKTGWSGLFTLPEGYTLYILVGGGIAVAGVLAYLFWPTKGLAKPAYTVLKTEEVKKVKAIPSKSKLESLKEFLNELKEKLLKIFKRKKAEPIYLGGQSPKT
jgi:hypothetical protein